MFIPGFLLHILLITISTYSKICLVEAQATNSSTNLRRPPPSPSGLAHSNVSSFAWSSWGKWSPCSRSCGGGISVQERHCLPTQTRWRRSRKRRKLVTSRPPITRDVTSVAGVPDCPGLGRRYHECNTAPCPGPARDPREEQCAVYDRRPFRGSFYTWVPYVDGKSPCTLNCRPRGQSFYASLALVADGTPCSRPGFRAICVRGECKVVGREGVLSAVSPGEKEARCGTRLVSGSFTRARLPLGYTLVHTVPQGACRLNVTELTHTDNYIALRIGNGSYIINGEFAVSAPGTYEAAGVRLLYSRVGGRDHVHAASPGPLVQPIDIMILYTQPNPSFQYEYTIDGEESNDIPTSNSAPGPQHPMSHHHRHQHYEHKTLDTREPKKPDFHSLESHSLQSNAIGERTFMWKILSFTQCSRTCGGGLQIGKFKCAEVMSSGDKEVSPAHCTGAPPPSKRRRCGLTPCPPRWRASSWSPCPVCGPAHRTRIVGCVQDHARGITKISDQKCPLPMPPNKEPCDVPACEDKLPSSTVDEPRFDARRQVRPREEASERSDRPGRAEWYRRREERTEWNRDKEGRAEWNRDREALRPRERTDAFRDGPVVTLASNVSDNEISPTMGPYSFSAVGGWLYTEWSQCVGWCVGGGVQSRGVRCNDPAGCARAAPTSARECRVDVRTCKPQWFTGEWSPCSAPCGGSQIRGVICVGSNGRRLRDNMCAEERPEGRRQCGGDCKPEWFISDWGECTGACEAGVQSRTVWCARGGAEGAAGAARGDACPGTRPAARRSCVPKRCSLAPSVTTSNNRTPNVLDSQQRVTRHQSQSSQNTNMKERSPPESRGGTCVDKLSQCALAVQARLCHYPYYATSCCHSCTHRRR